MKRILKKPFSAICAVIASIAVLLGVFYVFYIRPWDSGVVASFEAPDGSRYMVIQTYDSWSEPYSVRLYSKTSGGDWRSSYLDHESGSWTDASLQYDSGTKRVEVVESGKIHYVVDRTNTPVIGSPDVPPFSFPDA
jgi:hypothetical protein